MKHLKVFLEVYEDGFVVHKHTNKSLTGYYLVMGNLPLEEREKRENIFTLAITEKGVSDAFKVAQSSCN